MRSLSHRLRSAAPGVALCLAVTVLAYAGDAIETRWLGRPWLEALVVAILAGTALRTLWAPPQRFRSGIDLSAKLLLEIAVVLLGLSVSASALLAAGPMLIGGIVVVVALAIAMSYGIGRAFGLPHKLAVLIACGNSICGNSAIAATAPVIAADGDDVAASIAFTAVLGVLVVLALPLAIPLFRLSDAQYGIFAGLTVYAVPQVIAATAPVGPLSVQVGTLVKLTRVLMLGPVLLVLSLAGGHEGGSQRLRSAHPAALMPWFILGFLAMIGLRSSNLLPASVLAGANVVAGVLTVVAMAGLGLQVDVRMVARAGARVTAVVVLSLVALGIVSLGLVALR